MLALSMVSKGIPKPLIVEELGMSKDTLDNWIKAHRLVDPESMPALAPGRPAMTVGTVGDVRSTLAMVDAGIPLKRISRETGFDRMTIRRWRDDPRCREATYEYDPLFPYDGDDLLDRATVAQHLCSLTDCVDDRLELLLAVVGIDQEDIDDRTPTQASRSHGHRQRTANRKGKE